MMDKQIEEIQKILEYCCNEYDEKGRHIKNKCSSWDCEYYDETNSVCASYGLKEARALFNAGYRKIPENAVVLTREEWKRMKSSLYYSKEECERRNQKICKETAEKFAERVKMAFYQEFDELIPSIMADKIDEICKEITEGK